MSIHSLVQDLFQEITEQLQNSRDQVQDLEKEVLQEMKNFAFDPNGPEFLKCAQTYSKILLLKEVTNPVQQNQPTPTTSRALSSDEIEEVKTLIIGYFMDTPTTSTRMIMKQLNLDFFQPSGITLTSSHRNTIKNILTKMVQNNVLHRDSKNVQTLSLIAKALSSKGPIPAIVTNKNDSGVDKLLGETTAEKTTSRATDPLEALEHI